MTNDIPYRLLINQDKDHSLLLPFINNAPRFGHFEKLKLKNIFTLNAMKKKIKETELIFASNEHYGTFPGPSIKISDINYILPNGFRAIFEMQHEPMSGDTKENDYDDFISMLIYVAGRSVYSNQIIPLSNNLKKKYHSLLPHVMLISIYNFNLLPKDNNSSFINTAYFRFNDNRVFSHAIGITIVELPKIHVPSVSDIDVSDISELEAIGLFLRLGHTNEHQPLMKRLAEKYEVIKMATAFSKRMNGRKTAETIDDLIERDIAIANTYFAERDIYKKGRDAGTAEGKAKERARRNKEIALKLLAKNIDLDTIIDLSCLTEKEILKLKNTL
jgi:uncharacterized membrane protein